MADEDKCKMKLYIRGQIYTVREANVGDYKAVMDMSVNLLNGLDYIPSSYCPLLQRPSVRIYLAEHNGKPVSMILCELVEGTTMVYLGAARTHPDYTQKGIYFGMQPRVSAPGGPLTHTFPQITHRCAVGVCNQFFDKNVADGIYKKVYKWKFQVFRTGKQELSEALAKLPPDAGTSIVTSHDRDSIVQKLLTWDPVNFLYGYFLFDHSWIPRLVTKENLKYACLTTETIITLTEDQKSIGAVTFVEASLVQKGTQICAFFYSSCYENNALLLSHYARVAHIAASVSHPGREITIMIHFPLQMNQDHLLEYVRVKKLGQRVVKPFFANYQAGIRFPSKL